ncbi:16S rRNA (uracil(1498)-N(3))-methyltransferase [Leucobacter sp. CSA1]|uniref:Ribosomal RNA small subunit methyltransferase E n=1 Tax=Leucobacter chromiisoli TaxID=2796471 RepID=A0A934UTX1_9MICO|nr:16S rRNA (uracil(1498)-N(3))-methyltransferase [Leucobacter chromiisoli]MBK0418190.1 16S rRNA (uracil(1498)-N(3))-methyltransferase [Leucobacter chromiisoli]
MANLYFAEELPPGSLVPGEVVAVAGEEARHAVRVSRLRVGERTMVGDGRGTRAVGTVEEAARDRFTVRVEEVLSEPEPSPRLVLVQALAKGDRDERAVEQATEFGVDAIQPWQAERSVSRWDGPGGSEKEAKGVAKWRRIAREAAKQSLRARIPEVRDPVTLDGLRGLAASGDVRVVVLHPRGTGPLSDWARLRLEPGSAGDGADGAGRSADDGAAPDVYLVVGPEGGLSDREVDALQEAGAQVLLLGGTVLRTSSAGPAALAVLNVALGRW